MRATCKKQVRNTSLLQKENRLKPQYKIAFTGHRPGKIGGYDPQDPLRLAVKQAITDVLHRAIAKYGETHEIIIITGGALGVDQDAARVAHKLGLPFIVAVPFLGQERISGLRKAATSTIRC